MSRKKRDLKPEETALWQEVARSAQPLHPAQRSPKSAVKPAKISTSAKAAPHPLTSFELGSRKTATKTQHDLKPALPESVNASPVHMDRKSFTKMKRGKLQPEGRIDLHGMTLSQAHPALNRFILGSHAAGKRLVLVITGKGKSGQDHGPIPTPRGVLRHQVPQWLRQAPLAGCVLQVATAHIRHGGEGAYYVYLRRHR